MQKDLKKTLQEYFQRNLSTWDEWSSQLILDGMNDVSRDIRKHLHWLEFGLGDPDGNVVIPYSPEQAETDIRQILDKFSDKMILSLGDITHPAVAKVMINILSGRSCQIVQLLHSHIDCDDYVLILSSLLKQRGNHMYTLSLNLGTLITANTIRNLCKALEHPNNQVVALQLNNLYSENLNDDILNTLAEVLANPNCKLAQLEIGGWSIFSPNDQLFDDATKQNVIVDLATQESPLSREALAAVGRGIICSWQRYSQAYRQAVGEQKMTASAALLLAGLPVELIADIFNFVPPQTSAAYLNRLVDNTCYPNQERFRFSFTEDSTPETRDACASMIPKLNKKTYHTAYKP